MRIDSGLGFQFQIKKTSNEIKQTFSQLSSGKSINSAKDNPAGLALVNALAAQSSGLQASNSNISLAQSALATADGALSSTTDSLQQLRDLAVQAANGALSQNDRSNLQQQYDQVLSGIQDTATQTNFNGTALLDGSFSQSVQTGPNAGNSTDISIGSASTSALGISATGISTQSSAQDALAAIDSAISQVNSIRANIGASQSALEFTSSNNSIANENLQAAKSQAGDADYAALQSKLKNQQIQQQLQIQALSANQAVQKDITKLIR